MRKSAKSKSVSVETKLRIKRECIDEARDIKLKNASAHFTLDRYQIYQIARNSANIHFCLTAVCRVITCSRSFAEI